MLSHQKQKTTGHLNDQGNNKQITPLSVDRDILLTLKASVLISVLQFLSV